MPTIEHARAAEIYRIARSFADAAMRSDGSLHTRADVWTPNALDALAARFQTRFDACPGSFDDRWRGLLEGAEPDVRRLAAEVMCVHLLFPSDLAGTTKHGLVDLTDPDFVLCPALSQAFTSGVTRTGVAFKAARLSQLWFIVRAAQALKGGRESEREAVLADPWLCKRWLTGVEPQGGQPQREALLHLLFPDTFEPIVSVSVKKRIAAAFADHVPAAMRDVDMALVAIRRALASQYGPSFWFTDEPLAARWRTGGSSGESGEAGMLFDPPGGDVT